MTTPIKLEDIRKGDRIQVTFTGGEGTRDYDTSIFTVKEISEVKGDAWVSDASRRSIDTVCNRSFNLWSDGTDDADNEFTLSLVNRPVVEMVARGYYGDILDAGNAGDGLGVSVRLGNGPTVQFAKSQLVQFAKAVLENYDE